MAIFAAVNSRGAVTLPNAVLEALKLSPGEKVAFSLGKDGRVELRAARLSGRRAIADRAFCDLTEDRAAQRAAASRGLAALRGGIAAPPDSDNAA
ncbi:MAG: AbrB/MazE/SpoVT family DNA-binding domain-containing protein [Pseudomonadota bacterium]